MTCPVCGSEMLESFVVERFCDPETDALATCARALDGLELPARRRVLSYLTDRELCTE